MMASITMIAKPWVIPNFISVDVGDDGPTVSVRIEDADEATVRDMCIEFMKSVYDKANMNYDWRFE